MSLNEVLEAIMSAAQIQITAEDAQTISTMERDFNRRLWTQLDMSAQNHELFRQNLGLQGRLIQAFYVYSAQRELRRGDKADPQKIVACLGRSFDAVLPSLVKSFDEAKVIKALPDNATDERMISIYRQVGAHGLARMCEEKARRTAF